MDRVMVLLLEELLLERKDAEHLLYITAEILYAPLFPSPYLGRDIIKGVGTAPVMLPAIGCQELAYVEVEACIVDRDDNIGLP